MDTRTLPMIGVTLLEDFVKNPPPYFQVQHCMRHPVIRPVHNQVNLCAYNSSREAWFPDSMGRVLKVETVEQYDALVHRLLSCPIVLDVVLERSHKSGRIRYILKCDIIVTINTAHPVIRAQMQKLLEEGREDIVNGRNFAIDFDFDGILKSWFSSLHQGQDSILWNTTYSCCYAHVVVTNSTEFNTMFGCNSVGICGFIMCLPICIFMCPIYRISRCLTTVDRDADINGEVAYLTFKQEQRPAQSELLDMLRQYLVQQALQRSTRAREQPYLGVPDVTRQPNYNGGSAPQNPAEMLQPCDYASYGMGTSGQVEHPVAPYTAPPPAPGYTPRPGAPPVMPTPPHPPAPTGYPQGAYLPPPAGQPAPARPNVAPVPGHPQPELPTYDYIMGQTSDRDQLIT
ncbi:uncharacterized protein [Diadema antillarum]|uniref:uncharacterized protein n=1 Tax=Diadema antillarum TaxID=105358 RepID=UPI003A862B84